MARQARALSEAGLYHVMMRGFNQTQLFYDSDDRQAFLDRLARFKEECHLEIYAYCLMGNHVHLLIRETDIKLSLYMTKLAVSYAGFFNVKYDRRGALFEDRFKSEPVEDEAYLLTVFRYIHQNPLKVGETLDTWTSYSDYLTQPSATNRITDSRFVLGIFSDDDSKARVLLKEFLSEVATEETALEGTARVKTSDAQAIEVIKRAGKVAACSALAQVEKPARDSILSCLKKEGLSVRQIARLTGINRGIVQRA